MRKMTVNPPASINFPPPPPKLGLFFSPDYCRYRVAYGGRASGKSWAAVEGLIIRALQKPVRILCCREYQVTIRDSIKKVIEDSVNRFRDFRLFHLHGIGNPLLQRFGIHVPRAA